MSLRIQGGKLLQKNEFDQVARFQTKCENLPSTFTFKKQDQVVTRKLCQKAKYLLPDFNAKEHPPIAAQQTPEGLEENKNPTNKMRGQKPSAGQEKINLDPPSLE